eukprot:8698463-Ditylum_brightwellii.AAC.1
MSSEHIKFDTGITRIVQSWLLTKDGLDFVQQISVVSRIVHGSRVVWTESNRRLWNGRVGVVCHVLWQEHLR